MSRGFIPRPSWSGITRRGEMAGLYIAGPFWSGITKFQPQDPPACRHSSVAIFYQGANAAPRCSNTFLTGVSEISSSGFRTQAKSDPGRWKRRPWRLVTAFSFRNAFR